MNNEEIVAQLKQAQESRHLGHNAYTQGRVEESGLHFLMSYEIDLESQRALGGTPLVLHSLATDLMGLRLSLRGTSEEEWCCREIHALNQRRLEILGAPPNILKALASNLLYWGDLVKGRGDMVEAERLYHERQAFNLRRQKILGDKHNEVLGDLAIDLERLGDLAWDQGNLVKAKRYYFVNTTHLCNMPMHNLQWPELCKRCGQRLILLATNQQAHLPEVLPRLSLLSEVFVEYLDLQPTEIFEHVQASFASFHADYLELTLQHAPEQIPEILSALQNRKLASLVANELEARVQDHSEGTSRRHFQAALIELRRLAQGLRVILGDPVRSRKGPPAI